MLVNPSSPPDFSTPATLTMQTNLSDHQVGGERVCVVRRKRNPLFRLMEHRCDGCVCAIRDVVMPFGARKSHSVTRIVCAGRFVRRPHKPLDHPESSFSRPSSASQTAPPFLAESPELPADEDPAQPPASRSRLIRASSTFWPLPTILLSSWQKPSSQPV